MLVAERKSQKDRYQAWHDSLPEVEYPPEKLAELDEIYREAMEDMRAGRLVAMTAEELAAKLGIEMDEDDEGDDLDVG